MPRYQSKYSRDGILDFVVTKRIGDICMVIGTYKDNPDHHTYEVHRLRMKKAHPMAADADTFVCCSPSLSEWGKHGFTYTTQKDAEIKFRQLATT